MPFLPFLFRGGRATPTPAPVNYTSHESASTPPSSFRMASEFSRSMTRKRSDSTFSPSPSKTINTEMTSSPARPARPRVPAVTTALSVAVKPLPLAPLELAQDSVTPVIDIGAASQIGQRVLTDSVPPPHRSSHTRATSNPSPIKRSFSVRKRSNTVDRISATGTSTAKATPGGRRPAMLKLQTSNLTPNSSLETVENTGQLTDRDTTPTVRPHSNVAGVKHPMQPLLRRAESADEIPQRPIVEPVRMERRRSRSVGQITDTGLPLLDGLRESAGPPNQATTTSAISTASITPHLRADPSSSSVAPISRAFITVPLPWAPVPATSLQRSLSPSIYTKYLHAALPTGEPYLLSPSILNNASVESIRLKAELTRLQEKYEHHVRARDMLFRQLEQGLVKSEVGSLIHIYQAIVKAAAKCDRVARQIYICNDQIKQISIQLAQHQAACLRILSDNEQIEKHEKRERIPSSSSTATEVSEHSEFDEENEAIRPSIIVLRPLSPGLTGRSILVDERRTSAATVISVNHLGFPVPPNRHYSSGFPLKSPSPNTMRESTSCPESLCKASMIVEPSSSLQVSLDTSLVSSCSVGRDNEILIYPPAHKRSSSMPILNLVDSLPHTPWRADHASHQSLLPPINLDSSGDTASTGNTAPLVIRSPPPTKAKSLAVRRRKSTESTRRARRGRESQLETPESILLSLATAEIWTKIIPISRRAKDNPES